MVDGALWNIAFPLLAKFLSFGGQIVLAWLLVPADIGLAGMAQSMAAFTAILSVGGLSDVLVQRGRCREDAPHALWLSYGFTVATAVALAAIAVGASASGRPRVGGLVAVIALASLVGAPNPVVAAGLLSKLEFKVVALAQFVGGLVYTAVAVGLAWTGYGPYALVAPLPLQLLVTLVWMLTHGGSIQVGPLNWSMIKPLVRPTLALSVAGLFSGLQVQAPVFACGVLLGTAKTGVFSWAWSIASQAVFLVANNLKGVLTTVLAQVDPDGIRRSNAAMKAARAMTALLCVACGVQALLAQSLIGYLPAKWSAAGPIVMIFSGGVVLQGFWVCGMAWLNVAGRYRLLLWIGAGQAFVAVFCTSVGAKLGDVKGAAMGYALAGLVGALAPVLAMGTSVLVHQARRLALPGSLSAAIWLGCWVTTRNRGVVLQIAAATVFSMTSAYGWWRRDDGGLAAVGDRVRQVLRWLHFGRRTSGDG
jgi:PST family polysaccharide transporter